jgi:hypothetical protein
VTSEAGVEVPWRHIPGKQAGGPRWLVVLAEDESLEEKPEWLANVTGDDAVILVAPRGSGPQSWADPPPYYIQRSLPLLGRTVDSCRLIDVLAVASRALATPADNAPPLKIAGRGPAGIIGAYAALLEPRLAEVAVVEPPGTHRDGPYFLNVLRVIDIPGALGLLAPRPLTISSPHPDAFSATATAYRAVNGTLNLK